MLYTLLVTEGSTFFIVMEGLIFSIVNETFIFFLVKESFIFYTVIKGLGSIPWLAHQRHIKNKIFKAIFKFNIAK